MHLCLLPLVCLKLQPSMHVPSPLSCVKVDIAMKEAAWFSKILTS